MPESEALALLDERAGESICVAYRAERRSALVVALALVSGCLGVDSPELELPGEPESESIEPESLELELGELGVFVSFDGQPMANASILLALGDERWTGSTDAAGRWWVGLPAGDYTLRAQRGELGLSAVALVSVRAGESSHVEVQLAGMEILPALSLPESGTVLGMLSLDRVEASTVREHLTLVKQRHLSSAH